MKIVLVPSLLSLAAVIGMAQSPGTFTATGNMITPRYSHTATLLLNGKVLIAGGFAANYAGPFVSAEIYDPETGTFSSTGDMTVPLAGTSATLLPNGHVLIIGRTLSPGNLYQGPTPAAEVYDPVSGTFNPAGSVMKTQVACAVSTLLRNGKVLVSVGTYWPFQGVPPYLYDPTSATFAATGQYVTTGPLDEDICPIEVLLADGKVLTSWEGGKSEVYDPNSGTYFPTGDQHSWGNLGYTGTLLTTGNVLMAGGDSGGITELYVPATGNFTPIGDMKAQRAGHTATLLPDGTVLMAGGSFSFFPPPAELYQPEADTFTTTGEMVAERSAHTATMLLDGRVLIAGGVPNGNYQAPPLASAEIYHPPISRPAPALLSVADGQAAILHASTHQIVSQTMPGAAGEALEIYMTGLIDGSAIPPQVFIGGRMAEVLFFGNAPGFPGLNQINVRVPGGTAPGPAVPVRLVYLGRPSNEVTIGVH